MKDLKRIMGMLGNITFVLVILVMAYSVGNYRGQKHVRTKYQKTIDSLKVDSDNWWKKLKHESEKLDDIILFNRINIVAKEFENHSEIKK